MFGNPLENIRALEDVRFVTKGGEIYWSVADKFDGYARIERGLCTVEFLIEHAEKRKFYQSNLPDQTE